ncbi:MAG: cyanophycinase [Bacteroidales bacterium]|nr:cyanophycinase [Bacteroidales bacterium]
MNQGRSYLMLIGGAEDRTGNKVVLKKVVKTARAKNIIVIPTASSYPRDIKNSYNDAFKSIGIKNIDCFDIRYPDEADKTEYFETLEKAQLIFFSGGDQKRLVEVLNRTRLMDRIKERFYDGTLSIAGTSAGAAAVSDPMIYDGDYRGFEKDSINYSEGFGFLKDVTVDTHFLNRERIPRLTQFLVKGISQRGIGLSEDTGIIISPNLKFEVVGSGMVTLLNSEKITHTNYFEINDKNIFSVNNLRIGFLAHGSKFSIKKWSVLKSNDNTFYQKSLFERSWSLNC